MQQRIAKDIKIDADSFGTAGFDQEAESSETTSYFSTLLLLAYLEQWAPGCISIIAVSFE